MLLSASSGGIHSTSWLCATASLSRPRDDVEAGGETRVGRERRQALVGEAKHVRQVAFVSAWVEVTGTAQGMLATQ